jgi:formate/nitrite transporter FocA (FNT family)
MDEKLKPARISVFLTGMGVAFFVALAIYSITRETPPTHNPPDDPNYLGWIVGSIVVVGLAVWWLVELKVIRRK